MANELVPEEKGDVPELVSPANPFEGMATLPVSEKIQKILDAPPDPEEVQVAEDGTVYLPHEVYRDRLFLAFGSMGWGLVPVRTVEQNGRVIFQGRLICAGRVVGEDVGEAEYYPQNKKASWADSYKAAKSNCLKACCKDLIGGFTCLWNKQWREAWQSKYCVKVFRAPKNGVKQKPCWRRKDTKPFWDETGFVGDRKPAGSGAGGGHELRKEMDMKPREEDPVAMEARRVRREEIFAVPLELDINALKELIELCDTQEDLEEERLVELMSEQNKEDKAMLGRLYAERRHLIHQGGQP